MIDQLIVDGFEDTALFIIDADEICLQLSRCTDRLVVGKETKPRPSCRSTPEWFRQAAFDDRDLIWKALKGCDLVCVVAGLGGGFATGAVPVIVEIAKDLGAVTAAVVTGPFRIEGKRTAAVATDVTSHAANNSSSTHRQGPYLLLPALLYL